MPTDEIIEEIISDLAAGLIDKSDEEIADALAKYNLDPEDMDDVMQMIEDVRGAESLADSQAQDMANEDDTSVKVTEEDTDSDGDIDKTTIEKAEPEDDDKGKEDEPHDEDIAEDSDDAIGDVIKALSSHRW